MALNASIDLTVKKPDFKSMKSEIKELTIAAQQAVMQFGEFSPEAKQAEKALAEARDRMDDFNDRVSAVNPDKFAQINTVVQGVARGFQAAQGAMALFGNESKDLEKTMVKLQGAMALAEGLEGLGKVQQQFTAIAGNIKGGVINAFKALKNMSSLALGGIGIVLTLIIANFDTLKKMILSVLPGLGKMASYIGGLVQQFTDWVGITSAQDRALEKLNKTTTKSNEQLDREIELLQARGDELGVFEKKRTKLQNDLAQARANYGKNNEKEWGKIILDTKNALEVLKIEEEKYRKDQATARANAYQEERNKKDEKAKKDAEDAEKEHQRQQDLILTILGIRKKGIEQESKIRDDYAYKQSQRADIEYKAYQRQYSEQEQLTLFVKANHEELINSTIGYFNTIADLADAFAGRDEESQKRAFEIGKAMRYASTILSTIEGTQNAFTTAEKSPITAMFPGYPFVQATAAALFGVAQLAKIKQTQFKTTTVPSGNQMSGAGMPQMSAPRITSTLPTVGQFDTKVFVTEGDISRTSHRVDSTRKVSVVK